MKKLLNQSGIIHTFPLLIIIAAVGLISFLLISSTAPFNSGLFNTTNPKTASKAATSGCQFLTAPGTIPAFCDTFDKPLGIGNRSGDLNGLVWGVSRINGYVNYSQNIANDWPNTIEDQCGTNVQVQPPGDIHICNGLLLEGLYDNGGVTNLAIYPKQPFDFSGRTGIVVFDVSDNTQGPHSAWPEFIITDQPIPAPHAASPLFGTPPSINTFARNSFGISLASVCTPQHPCPFSNTSPTGATGPCATVDEMAVTNNYQESDITFNKVGCVLEPTKFGQLDHFEVRISQSHVEIWGSDPSSTAIRELAWADVSIPLTKGLIWIEDLHYNACKDGGTLCNNTLAWDNVGFDGPILPRDLAFDIPDNTTQGPISNSNPSDPSNILGGNNVPSTILGYKIPGTSQLNLSFQNVSGVQNAPAALLEMNSWPISEGTINYSLNGHPSHQWPFIVIPSNNNGGGTYGWRTNAMPVPVNEVVNGTNSLTLSTSDGQDLVISNLNLILVAAGGIPCSINPSQPCNSTPSPSAQSSPTPSPTGCPRASLGDIDCNGLINIFDYNILIANFGKLGAGIQGDLNGDNTVNIFDYNLLIGNFGK